MHAAFRTQSFSNHQHNHNEVTYCHPCAHVGNVIGAVLLTDAYVAEQTRADLGYEPTLHLYTR